MNLTQQYLTQIVPNSLKVIPTLSSVLPSNNSKWSNIETPFSTEVDVKPLKPTDFRKTHRITIEGVLFKKNIGDEMNHGIEILNFKSNTFSFQNLPEKDLEQILSEIKLAVYFHDELEVY